MKAQARIKAPDEFYDIKLNQAQLSIEELSIYVKVDAKLGLNKLRTAALSPKKSISKKSRNTKGQLFFSDICLILLTDDIFVTFITKLKEQLKKCREIINIVPLGISIMPDIKNFDISSDQGARDYFNLLEKAIEATKTINCYLHFSKVFFSFSNDLVQELSFL